MMASPTTAGHTGRPWIPPPTSASLDHALEEVSSRVRLPAPSSPLTTLATLSGPSPPPSQRGCRAAPLTLRALTLTEATHSPWEKANESSGQREARAAQAFSTVKQAHRGCTFWVPDADVHACMHCGKAFTWKRRKHHCRFCGRIFCAACSRYRLAVPARLAEDGYKPERACTACVHAQSKKRQYKCNGSCGAVHQYCMVEALLSHLALEHRDAAVPHLRDMKSAAAAPSRCSDLSPAEGDPPRNAASPTNAYTLMQVFLQWAMARQRLRRSLQAAAQVAAAEHEMTAPLPPPPG